MTVGKQNFGGVPAHDAMKYAAHNVRLRCIVATTPYVRLKAIPVLTWSLTYVPVPVHVRVLVLVCAAASAGQLCGSAP